MMLVEQRTKSIIEQDLGGGLTLRTARLSDRDNLIKFNGVHLGQDSEIEVGYLVDGKYPGLGIEDFLVVVDENDQIISSLSLLQVDFRIGQTWLKLAQPEFVATDPQYRGRGLVRKQFDVLHQWMRELNLPFAIIGGIDYFYRQFGYEYGIEWQRLGRLTREQAADLPPTPGVTVRRATVEDAPVLQRIMEEQEAPLDFELKSRLEDRIAMLAVRSWENSSPQDYIAEKDGKALNFVRIWKPSGDTILTYHIGDNLEGSIALARYALTEIEGVEKMNIGGLKNLAFAAEVAKHWHGFYQTVGTYTRIGDPVEAFRQLADEFERRIAASEFAGLSREVELGFFRYTIGLVFENGKITEVKSLPGKPHPENGFAPDLLPKMLFGFRTLEELGRIYPDCYSQKDWELMTVLFPKLNGQMRFFLF
jgi:GNAT superfamily N-acetyltransferase